MANKKRGAPHARGAAGAAAPDQAGQEQAGQEQARQEQARQEQDEIAAQGPLMLGGTKNGPQKKAAGKNDWSEAKATKFIAALADSCNVTLAARAIRRSVSSVYVQRSKNADFRRQWDQALSTGYSRLELMMLERALHGTEKLVPLKSGESRIMRAYDDRIALALLRLHRDRVSEIDAGVDAQAADEARERILDRLERLRERDEGIEVKAARDAIGLIGWGVSARRR